MSELLHTLMDAVWLLLRRAALPVEEARDGVKISPDRLYVITPHTTLTISNDVLHSRIRDPAERPHRPVDTLFHSPAEKKGPNVGGVILSGSGSDGARGIQAIKEARWSHFRGARKFCLVFRNAKQRHPNGMRGFVLAPRHIAQELINISRLINLLAIGPGDT
jgi:two-component system, chemotaxis family, CheB/CheR fusion protein